MCPRLPYNVFVAIEVLGDSLGVNTCIQLSVLMRHARADDLYVVLSFIFCIFWLSV